MDFHVLTLLNTALALCKEHTQRCLIKWELLLKRGKEDFSLKTFSGGCEEYSKNRGGGFPGCMDEPHCSLCGLSALCPMWLLNVNLEGTGTDG